jgi:hypothetical protein
MNPTDSIIRLVCSPAVWIRVNIFLYFEGFVLFLILKQFFHLQMIFIPGFLYLSIFVLYFFVPKIFFIRTFSPEINLPCKSTNGTRLSFSSFTNIGGTQVELLATFASSAPKVGAV